MSENMRRILKEGVIGGAVAYLAVVLVFAVYNVLMWRSPFHTAAAMGSLLLHGSEASVQFAVEAGPVLAYNGVHLVGSLLVGVAAAALVFETEMHRSLWYFTLMVLVAAVMYSITVFGVFGVEIGGVLDWPSVVLGTMVWIGAMTAYFWGVHRGLMGRIRNDLEEERAETPDLP